jgi:[ribosomal protein S5]-alanine N-acetyltransferase
MGKGLVRSISRTTLEICGWTRLKRGMTLAQTTSQIESDRLILRRMTDGDLDYFAAIHADNDVARYIGTGEKRTRAQTEKWFGDIQATYRNANLGQLAVTRKSDGAVIGRCGLSDAVVERTCEEGQVRKGWFFSAHAPPGLDVEPLPELGYTFGKEYWGLGYASEAARCVYHYVLTERVFPKIMSVIHADNAASLAVAKKHGVTFVDCVEMAGRTFERYHWPMERS